MAWAFVADPTSPRMIELAKAGASVTSGGDHDSRCSYRGARGRRFCGAHRPLSARLVAIMARLRSDDGCPWDREQTHESLKVHLVEEAHEVIETIEDGNIGPELEEELGDLLLQVAFHSAACRAGRPLRHRAASAKGSLRSSSIGTRTSSAMSRSGERTTSSGTGSS